MRRRSTRTQWWISIADANNGQGWCLGLKISAEHPTASGPLLGLRVGNQQRQQTAAHWSDSGISSNAVHDFRSAKPGTLATGGEVLGWGDWQITASKHGYCVIQLVGYTVKHHWINLVAGIWSKSAGSEVLMNLPDRIRNDGYHNTTQRLPIETPAQTVNLISAQIHHAPKSPAQSIRQGYRIQMERGLWRFKWLCGPREPNASTRPS